MRLGIAVKKTIEEGKTIAIKNMKGRLLFDLKEIKTAGKTFTSQFVTPKLPLNPMNGLYHRQVIIPPQSGAVEPFRCRCSGYLC